MSEFDTDTAVRRHRPSRRAVALTATAVVLVAVLAGAAVWALAGGGTSRSADAQWLAKVRELTSQFPPDYRVAPTGSKEVTEQSMRERQDLMEGATIIPSDCTSPASAIPPLAGVITDGLKGETADRLLSVNVVASPQPITVQAVPPHCKAVMFYQPGFIRGFTSPVALPPIPQGVSVVSTDAVRISSTITDATGQNIDGVQYVYSALLDEHHTVSVMVTAQIAPGAPRELDPTPAQHLFTQALITLKTA